MSLFPVHPLSASARRGLLRFENVVIVGKYQAPGSRDVVEEVAQFLHAQGCEVSLERDTALNTGLTHYPALDVPTIGTSCHLALVVGGDGTMLGIGRQLAWVSSQTFPWKNTGRSSMPSCTASSKKTPAR
jgi:NAD+ kinase